MRWDEQFMQLALAEARRGEGLTRPNPPVGAVLVDARGEMLAAGRVFVGARNIFCAAGEKFSGVLKRKVLFQAGVLVDGSVGSARDLLPASGDQAGRMRQHMTQRMDQTGSCTARPLG